MYSTTCGCIMVPIRHHRISCGVIKAVVELLKTAVCREVCEVVMSHETLNHPFSGPRIAVEVDETYLTRRKYHKGRHLQSETIKLLGIYERASNLSIHFLGSGHGPFARLNAMFSQSSFHSVVSHIEDEPHLWRHR